MKLFSSLLLFLSLIYFSAATAQSPSCGDKAIETIQQSNIRDYNRIMQDMNLQIKGYIDAHFPAGNGNASRVASTTSYVIPVVFHIVHPVGDAYGSGANVSYMQILSQVNALNAAFAKNYPAYNGQSHASYAQNTHIQFCLASTPMPSSVSFYNGPGGVEKGVMRYADNTLTNHQMSNSGAASLLALTHPSASYFPFGNYLNIWVVSSIGNSSTSGITMGYAPKPLMGAYPLDGIVMRADVIGDNTTGNSFALGYGLTQGKVLVHEAGHYFNLMHIFEGGCAGANAAGSGSDACDLNGDMICDIEPCTTQNISCNAPVPNTCVATYSTGTTANDMIEDYMSYADDDCMNTFTQDQTLRMHATLNTIRSTLWQTGNLAATGVMGTGGCSNSTLYISIIKPMGSSCLNTPVALSNSTPGNTASSWHWVFNGGTPATANTNSVSVTYTAPGIYYAKLTVSDGTVSVTDSVPLAVTSCTLDPKKLNRSNWLFGDSCSISFASGTAVPNNLVKQKQTIRCFEMAVSMSDSLGNLLFYSDGVDLWDNTHTKVNTSPLFGWDISLVSPAYKGSSVFGFMSFPMPKQPNKYALICAPPNETIGSALSAYDKVSCVIYDAVNKQVSPYQSWTDPNVNPSNMTFLTEDLCIVPHCNGVDYWMILRAYVNSSTNGGFYAFLINANGFNTSSAPVVSIVPNPPIGLGGIKSNAAGNRLICNSCSGHFMLYDFNAATGVVSNEVPVPVTLPLQTNSCCIAGLFSPNGNYLYLKYSGTSTGFIQKVAVSSMSVLATYTSSSANYGPQSWGYMEVGPDNNIYFDSNNYWYLGQIVNPDSPTLSGMGSAVAFNPAYPNCSTNLSLVNYVEADKPAEVDPLLIQNVNCTTYSYSLSPCWAIYNASWNFGDGSPSVAGAVVSHSYTSGGVYTVSLTLSYNGQSIPVFTKTISVVGASASISGPSSICKGNTFANSYSTLNVPGATYNWQATNAVISGPNNIPSIQLISGGTGVATLSLQVISGGCMATTTKTITIDTIPHVLLNSLPVSGCVGSSFTLSGSPAGGNYSGAHVSANVFTPMSAGTQPVYYTYTNANGCSSTGSLSIIVNTCVGINEAVATPDSWSLYPNPTCSYIHISSDIVILKVEVINNMGQIVAVKTNIRQLQTTMELGELAPGVYVVQVYTERGLLRRKVMRE
ncbi:MAG: T9SS type A sorting domain-containing protein [Bacteroidetes bacterium]|nr:T9SS type A sorting domain-containing protein [Bacteroidota bacterium]